LTYRVVALVKTDNSAIWPRIPREESSRLCLLHVRRCAAARDSGGKRGAAYDHSQADHSFHAPHRRPSLAEAQLSCLRNRVKLRARAQFAEDRANMRSHSRVADMQPLSHSPVVDALDQERQDLSFPRSQAREHLLLHRALTGDSATFGKRGGDSAC